MRWSPGCNCCHCKYPKKIGFDREAISLIVDCCQPNGYKTATNLCDHIDRLDECEVVFCGSPNTECGPGICFVEDDWETITEWIENGNRLFVNAEYKGCISLVAKTTLNEFLSAIGTEMSIGDVAYDCGCSPEWTGIIQELPLTENVEVIFHACTNSVEGGTVVAYCNEDEEVPYIAVEAVGDGFVLCCGDSSVFSCSYDNCTFWDNFIRLEGSLI